MDPIQKMLQIRLGQGEMVYPQDPDTRKNFPNLWHWMTTTRSGDILREPSALSVRMAVQAWSVGLRDETLKISLETTVPTLQEAFTSLELLLAEEHPPWRSWKGQEPVVRKVKKDEKKD